MGKSFKLGNSAVCSYCKTFKKDIGIHLLDFHYKCKTCGRWDKSKEFHKCWKKLKESDVFILGKKAKSDKKRDFTIRTVKCPRHQGIKLTRLEIKQCGVCKVVPFYN